MNLNELKEHAYKTACKHGWHNEEQSDETYLMLIITEIAEAINADRKDKYANTAMFKEWQGNNLSTSEETRTRRFKEDFEAYIKDTVEDELADTVIRCLDFAGLHGMDLQEIQDSILVTSAAEEFLDGCTFAEVAFGICEGIIIASNYKYAVQIAIQSILDYCQYKSIDIFWYIEQKMCYNELRDYKHGNKKY